MSPSPVSESASLTVPIGPDAARIARSFVRDHLGRYDRLDDALLATSELVTNVVLHARQDSPLSVLVERPSGRAGRAPVRVTIRQASGTLELTRGGDGHGGRGLVIVERVADAWGSDTSSVWFEVEGPDAPAPPSQHLSAGSLQHDRDRSVVDQFDDHVGAEAPQADGNASRSDGGRQPRDQSLGAKGVGGLGE